MSDDLISRQAAIDTFEKELSAKYNGTELAIGFVGIESILKNEPSAQPKCEDCGNFNKTRLLIPQPERKKGKWLWVDGVRCSECNHKLQTTGLPSSCTNCGAEMK